MYNYYYKAIVYLIIYVNVSQNKGNKENIIFIPIIIYLVVYVNASQSKGNK